MSQSVTGNKEEGNIPVRAAQNAGAWQEGLTVKLMALASITLRSHDAQRDGLLIEGILLTGDQTAEAGRVDACMAALDAVLQDSPLPTQIADIRRATSAETAALKAFLLAGLRALADAAKQAADLGKRSYHVNYFFYQSLAILAEDCPQDMLLSLATEMGKVLYLCMELREKAQPTAANQLPMALPTLSAQLAQGLQSGQIGRILILGGCGETEVDRAYYQNAIVQAPPDSVLFLLQCETPPQTVPACGSIGDLPRLLPMGQGANAWAAITTVLSVATQLGKHLLDMPLSLSLSGRSDATVGLLLSLLTLHSKPLYLGPTLPDALDACLLELLGRHFGLTLVGAAAQG